MSTAHPLRSRLRELYFGHTESALRFQALLFVLDLAIVGFFVFSQFIRDPAWFWFVDIGIAVFLMLEMAARLFAFGTVRRWIIYPATWADIVVLATLIIPALSNLGFLRVLRLWALVQSERFWNVLARGRWDDTHVEDLTKSIVTLSVFMFMAAGATQAFFLREHPELNNFVDALYFVASSLTTTGYGDIAFDSVGGRLFSIALMITGITLFIRIAQRATLPHQKLCTCVGCGLERHEQDAVHCRACGEKLPPALRGRARAARRRAVGGG